jgi:hypothetical protein
MTKSSLVRTAMVAPLPTTSTWRAGILGRKVFAGVAAVKRLWLGHRLNHLAVPITAAICLAVALAGPARADELVPAGTLTISQVQVAFIGSGNLGGGKLLVGGKSYSFTIGGLGVGGIGLSRMEAVGTVYNLRNIADFAGGYVQARYGMVIGEVGGGALWLQNTRGVVLKLDTERVGLALSLGGDAVYIKFD